MDSTVYDTVCDRLQKIDNRPCMHYIKVKQGQAGLCSLPGRFLCDESLKRFSPRLSHSTALDWRRCRKLFYYRHVQGITVRPHMKSIALKLGTVWDEVVECKTKTGLWSVDQPSVEKLQVPEFDLACVSGMVRACEALEVELHPCEPQVKIEDQIQDGPWIKAILDGRGDGFFVEDKFTFMPNEYFDPFNLTSQVGTYFLLDDSLEYCVIRAVRKPGLRPHKPTKKRENGETVAEFEERVYQDIISKPKHYLPYFDPATKLYGRRFYPTEFDLASLLWEYAHIGYDISVAQQRGAFYPNYSACRTVYGMCDYRSICDTGGVSDEYFERRDKAEYGGNN